MSFTFFAAFLAMWAAVGFAIYSFAFPAIAPGLSVSVSEGGRLAVSVFTGLFVSVFFTMFGTMNWMDHSSGSEKSRKR